MTDGGWPKPARPWGWVTWVPTLLCPIIGVWVLISFSWLAGVSPGDEVVSSGTAHIQSCERDPVRLWLVFKCHAEVDLGDVPRFPRPAHLEAARSANRVTSTHRVEGRVAVELVWHSVGRRGGGRDAYDVVPVDRPRWPLGDGGWVFLVVLPGIAASALLGIFISRQLGWRLPQSPPDAKDFRGVRRLPAGPRRGKRKRRTR